MADSENKRKIYEFLAREGIPFERTEHEAVFNMEELDSVQLPYPEWDAKNLFVRDDKKQGYYLITVRGDKRVDLKAFRREHGLRPLTFCSPDELFSLLGLTPGSVSPLGILNDGERRVQFFLDAEFRGNRIGVHPNDNTATVWLSADDLTELIRRHGNRASYVELETAGSAVPADKT